SSIILLRNKNVGNYPLKKRAVLVLTMDKDLKSVFPPKMRYWELGWLRRLDDKEKLFRKIILAFILGISFLVAFGLYFLLSGLFSVTKHSLIPYGLAHLIILGTAFVFKNHRVPEYLYLFLLYISFVLNYFFPIMMHFYMVPFLMLPLLSFFFGGIRQGTLFSAITMVSYIAIFIAGKIRPDMINGAKQVEYTFVVFSNLFVFESLMLFMREYVRRDEKMILFRARTYDETTNLPKRYLIEHAVEKTNYVYIAILSIKNLSHIGIIMGYDFLTRVTVKIANMLKQFQKEYGFGLYRLTKGEFGIVFESGNQAELVAWAENVIGDISGQTRNIKITNDDLFIYAEMDIGTALGRADHISEILSKADQIKIDSHNLSSSRRQFVMDSDIRERFIEDQTRYDVLLSNITEKKMEVHYQPILDLSTGKLFFHEALLRLRDGDNELVSVYPYLDIAKKTGIYSQLTFFVLHTFFDLVKKVNDICFSLNLSIDDISNPSVTDFLQDKKEFLKKYNNRLIFEITETEISRESKEMLSFLKFAREINMRIAIDDFGTGYSNFTRLSDFPPFICKIDGQLFQKAYADSLSAKVLDGIINLCRNLNVHTVAEYIETEEHKAFAREKKIDFGQGYLFSKPGPRL
ncbi:MAG: EAL domain-containing protein, partial [Spirochaetales bacterium]|nr:EAL domain-containing protein [Spirochaetales bacterium]